MAVECSASLFDIRCELFDRQPIEVSFDATAIRRQREVIANLHFMGEEVLISLMCYATPPQRAKEILSLADFTDLP